MNIPFVDLTTQYRQIKSEIDEAISRVMVAGQFVQGPDVAAFENEFARYIGSTHCISLNSGTDALILGMRALDLTPGDEVIVPANTFIATALGASENGLTPVFTDIDPSDYGMNLNDLKKKITPKTKAIIVVHLYGQPDKLEEIQSIIRSTKQQIYLIEDACQSHGATYKGKTTGTIGTFGAFSFYPGKNLGAYGDGGALVTNDSKLAEKVRRLREYGQRKKYYHDISGINTRLDSLQAAILRVKLKHLDVWTHKRQQIAKWYCQALQKLDPTISLPPLFADRLSVFHLFVIRHPRRDELINFLASKDISALIHYPVPLHLQKAYAHLGYTKNSLPVVERISNEILSLPIYPEMTQKMVKYIVDAIAIFDSL